MGVKILFAFIWKSWKSEHQHSLLTMVKKCCFKLNKSKHCLNHSAKSKYKDEDSDAGWQADQVKSGFNEGATLQAVAKWTFLEYFKESSIHGFKYIGNRHKHSIPDRIIWILALVLSIITCYFCIRDIWNQRTDNPAIVSFNAKQTPVWKIPFPTVTICSETKTNTEIFNFTKTTWKIDEHKNLTEKEQFYWAATLQICRQQDFSLTLPKDEEYANATDLIEAMTQMTSKYNGTFIDNCEWRNGEYCFDQFQRVITEDGICYSFNSLKSNYYREELKNAEIQDEDFYNVTNDPTIEWNVEKGYNKTNNKNSFPRRSLGSGEGEGIDLILNSFKQDTDFLCRNYVTGFKLILSTPGEEPQVFKNFLNVPFAKSVVVSIKPKILDAYDGLQAYAPHKRQCYYQNERPLRYFRFYNQPNCEHECIANITLERCGCVKFSMPRNSSHRVCGTKKISCMLRAKSYVNEINFERSNNHQESSDPQTVCDCLPLCTSIQYKPEMSSQIEFDYVGVIRAYKMSEFLIENPGYELTQIKIHFKDDRFNGLKRSELCSIYDFIANCGGLLGLFMGISILSLVEVVYFFTLKLWTNLKIRKLKNLQPRKFKEEP